jgi:hypothetical protein
MKTIHFGKSTILTSDDVADAVIEYAAALCNGNCADVVRVPSVAQDGTASITAMLLGPASQIVIVDADVDELEKEHPVFVARLQAAAATFPHAETLHASDQPTLSGVAMNAIWLRERCAPSVMQSQ